MVAEDRKSKGKVTYSEQENLPKLPIPKLEDTIQRYLAAVRPLQNKEEHAETKRAAEHFLAHEGPKMHNNLIKYSEKESSYISSFWFDAYLSHSDSVVLNLNPFFVLEDDPTPSRGNQSMRAASLILSATSFVSALRTETLPPDYVRGTPLDMSQYSSLFSTSRIPTKHGCRMSTDKEAKHIIVMARGTFYWFDVLDDHHRVGITEKELLNNLHAIRKDAQRIPKHDVAKRAVGVLSTENRRIWSGLRDVLSDNETNAECLRMVDTSLFVVCLDDFTPSSGTDVSNNMLCGTYRLDGGVQTGTCTNRWYDKLQIIVCENGSAGINFEHTSVDGHTVLRFVSDIYTDTILRFARTINNSAAHSLFDVEISPHAAGAAKKAPTQHTHDEHHEIDTSPKRIEWSLTPDVRLGIRFAESRLSDLICQNETRTLEYDGYGKNFITRQGFSPDAFVQMAFQAAYYALYGRVECTYEPAMTKQFYHGRTEAIRSVTDQSAYFVKTFCSGADEQAKLEALRAACKKHVELTKECSKGMGQDRHLYAMLCLWKREQADMGESPDLPSLYADSGWTALNHTVLSTSNCGNPALRLFGFGPVAADGFGIGYIIGDSEIKFCAASKHLQTDRYLHTLRSYLQEIQRMLLGANRRPSAQTQSSSRNVQQVNGTPKVEEEQPWPSMTRRESSRPSFLEIPVDPAAVVGDRRVVRPTRESSNMFQGPDEEEQDRNASNAQDASLDEIDTMGGYGFFDSGEMEALIARQQALRIKEKREIGTKLRLADV